MNTLKTWFNNLADREQKLVIVCAIAIVIAIFYFAIWSPLHTSVDSEKLALERAKSDLIWVKEQGARASLLRQNNSQQSYSGSLSQLINQTSRQANISLSRLQPMNDDLMVSIDQVEFNRLLMWLNTLENRGVSIIQSDISELDEAGYVQVRRIQLGKS